MARKKKVEEAMDRMEQFEQEYLDTSHELDGPEEAEGEPAAEAAAEDPADASRPAEGTGESEDAREAADQDDSGETAEAPTDGGAERKGDEPHEPSLYTIPNDPDSYGDLAGKKVTEAEFLASGLINKLLTREHQELHHMKKYNEEIVPLRKEMEELKKRLEAPKEAPPQEPMELTPERVQQFSSELERNLLPQIERFAEMGGIEDHMVTDSPKFLTMLEYRLQSGQKLLDALTKGFGALAADWMERNQATQHSEARTILESTMMETAKTYGFDQLQSDESHREAFGNWLAEREDFQNRNVNEIAPDLLRFAYMAFADQTGRAPAAAAREDRPQRRKPEAALATGGGVGGSRGGVTVARGEIDKFIREYEESTGG